MASLELSKQKCEIAFITEPYIQRGKITSLLSNSSSNVLVAEGVLRPRAALRIGRGLHPWIVPQFSGEDICTACFKINGKTVYACSLYLDIEKTVHHRNFLSLVEHCHRERSALVVGTDSNAHSPMWGSADLNSRGEELETIVLSKNLTVLNVGDEPTFSTSRAESVIDVTLMNNEPIQTLKADEWRVCDQPSFSDHKYIKFTLGQYSSHVEKYQNLKRADWTEFRTLLNQVSLKPILADGSNLDECADQVQEAIRMALDQACPWKEALQRTTKPWWSKELDAVRQELKTLAMKRRRSAEHEYAYKALLTLYKRKVVTARRDSWREFCTKVETIKDTAKIMKIIRPQRKVGVSLFDNQGMVLNSADTLKNLMDTHFIDSVQMEENDCKRATISSGRKHHNEELDQFIDEQKVFAALESFGPLKAPGPDGFCPLEKVY